MALVGAGTRYWALHFGLHCSGIAAGSRKSAGSSRLSGGQAGWAAVGSLAGVEAVSSASLGIGIGA